MPGSEHHATRRDVRARAAFAVAWIAATALGCAATPEPRGAAPPGGGPAPDGGSDESSSAAVRPADAGAAAPYRTDVPACSDTAELAQDHCDAGNASACFCLGNAAYFGNGTPKDAARALAAYVKACDGGILASCRNVGLLSEGRDGLTADPARGLAVHQKACDNGYPLSCGELALFYWDGKGVAASEETAAALLQKGCDAENVDACRNLGKLYLFGERVPHDFARADRLVQRACDLDVGQCGFLARLLTMCTSCHHADCGQTSSVSKADAEGGAVRSCPPSLPTDRARAAALFKRGCDQGQRYDCEMAAELSYSPVPSGADFDAARSVVVTGASALRCQAKIAREWLRISCRGRTFRGGTPVKATIEHDALRQTETHAFKGGEDGFSLFTPFVEGAALEATFAWTDGVHRLSITWPTGKRRPAVIGEIKR